MSIRLALILCIIFALFPATACSKDASTSTSTPEKQEDHSGPLLPQDSVTTNQYTGDYHGMSPDIVFYNGTVLTMEQAQPQVEAIAIRGDMILAIGNNDEILALNGSETQEIDLGGRTLLPGFIDSHDHWIGDISPRYREKGVDTIYCVYYLLAGCSRIAAAKTNKKATPFVILSSINPIRNRSN